MAIPETIKQLATDIRTKIYGKDVRESLARGIEESGSMADDAIQITQQLLDDSYEQGLLNTEIENRMDNLYTTKGQMLNDLHDTEKLQLEALQQEFADKAQTLETTYAPRLTDVETELNKIPILNEQLAQTDKQVIDITPLNLDEFKRNSGEFDDSGLIQRAIDIAKDTRQEIFVPSKVFEFSQTLQMYSNVSFVGQSKRASFLKYTGNGVAFNFVDPNREDTGFGKGCYYNNLTNLKILGSGKDGSSISINGELRYSHFDNVEIEDFNTIFNVKDNWTNKYVNCIFNKADTWYKGRTQNNAVSFVNCTFHDCRVGFEMNSTYGFKIIGGNIEVCSEVLFKPFTHSGAQWSNFSIDSTYTEITSPMIDTVNLNAGNGNPITSWELIGFSWVDSNINFFNADKFFIETRLSGIIKGYFKNDVFYKKDDTKLFDMTSTAIIFDDNVYRYFDTDGIVKTLTNPFSEWMETWATGYQVITNTGGGIKRNSARGEYQKGFTTLFTELTPTTSGNARNNSLFISSSDGLLKFKDNTGAVKTVNLT